MTEIGAVFAWGIGAATLCVLACAAVLWLLHRRRRCVSCGVGLVAVDIRSDGALRASYEVMACPHCTNALTLVHGTRARYATCPDCRQRTLETPCIRLPDAPSTNPPPETRRRVEVHEHCHLCGHAAVIEVSDQPFEPQSQAAHHPRGQVIPFPTGRRRSAHGGEDA
jgi:hypothetical protein